MTEGPTRLRSVVELGVAVSSFLLVATGSITIASQFGSQDLCAHNWWQVSIDKRWAYV